MNELIKTQKAGSKVETIKPGDVFYSAYAYYDIEDSKCKLDLDEWHVRSIRAKRGSKTKHGLKVRYPLQTSPMVNLVLNNPFTWVKKSSRHGDWGWATSIPEVWRKQFTLGNKLPHEIFPSRTTALKSVYPEIDSAFNDGEISSEHASRLTRMVDRRIRKCKGIR